MNVEIKWVVQVWILQAWIGQKGRECTVDLEIKGWSRYEFCTGG